MEPNTNEHSVMLKYPKAITYVEKIECNSDNKKASGFYNELNKEQYDNFVKFKNQILQDKLVENYDVYDDLYILRFLRARKFDLEKTMIMFKNFLNWRKEKNVDDIRENWVFTEMFEVKKYYPHSYHKTDKTGRPIYIEMLSELKYNELFKVTTEERMTNYYIKEYERLMWYRFPACSAAMKRPVEQSCTILDVKGIGITSLIGKTREFLKIASAIGQDYYPEMLGSMFLLNASFFFRAVWALAKTFIDEKTAKKINLLSTDYAKTLLEYIEPQNLPAIIGGTCTCPQIEGGCLYSDIGPWNPLGGIIIGDKDTYKGQ